MDSIMDEIAKNLIYYRKQHNYTQKDLAKKLGVANTTISGWETGASSIDIDTLYQVCKVLSVPVGEMYGKYQTTGIQYNDDEKGLIRDYRNLDERGKGSVRATVNYELEATKERNRIVPPVYSFAKASSRRNVPILGYTAAGSPIEAIEQEIDMPEGEDIPDRATLGLVVRGDSMEPVIMDGSIVWVDGTAIPHSGDIGVFLIDGEATCKKLVKVNNRYVLRSLNPAYDDIEPADWQDVRPVGKVVMPRKDYVFQAARGGSVGPITDPEGIYEKHVEAKIVNERVAKLKKEGKLKPHDEF